jgi:hypothetical protein
MARKEDHEHKRNANNTRAILIMPFRGHLPRTHNEFSSPLFSADDFYRFVHVYQRCCRFKHFQDTCELIEAGAAV